MFCTLKKSRRFSLMQDDGCTYCAVYCCLREKAEPANSESLREKFLFIFRLAFLDSVYCYCTVQYVYAM